MSGLGQQKQEVISKIRAVTKIVNEQSSNPLDSFIDNTLGSFIDDGFKSFDKMSPKKLTDLQTKESLKKENKTDIFGDLIDITDAFLTGANKKIKFSNNPLDGQSRLKQIINESVDDTIKNVKPIISNAAKQTLFVGDGICGTQKTFTSDTLNIKPQEFDFLNVLQVDPLSSGGQILYEGLQKGNQLQLNNELYNSFSTADPLHITTPNGNVLMSMKWDSANQHFQVSGLTENSVNDFIEGYYSTIEHIDLTGVTKMSTLMTLKGDDSLPKSFDVSMNDLNRLLSKVLKSCNGIQTTGLSSSNFNTNDEIEENYFDFDNVEGIDLDEERRQLEKVLHFKDCGNIEVPTDKFTFQDFAHLTNNTSTYSLNQIVDSTLYNVANAAYQDSNAASLDHIHINLVKNFSLNMPKALVGSVMSPKYILPISIVYKSVVNNGNSAITYAKEIMKNLYKFFNKVIKDIFWKFINNVWTRIKRDLLDFLKAFAYKILKDKAKKYALILSGLIALIQNILNNNIDNCNALYNIIIGTINTALSASTANLNLSGILASFANLRPGTDQNLMLMNFIENAQKNGVNTNDIFGQPNKLINHAKSSIDSIMDNFVNNGKGVGGNETGFGFTAEGAPVMIPRGSLTINSIHY